MKKIVLSALVVGALLVSCKSEKKEAQKTTEEVKTEVKQEVNNVETKLEEGTKKVSDMLESALEGVSIPKFEDPKVGEFLQGYATHAKEYIEAKGDVLKNAKLAKKSVEYATKAKDIVANLDEESTAKFKSVMSAIQSKMAPAK